GLLTVRFADGEEVSLPATQLTQPRTAKVRWERLEVVDCYHLRIPALHSANDDGAETLDIPGFTIRALTDPEFSAHLARAAAEQARHVGQRLRELRVARGLSAKSVAQRAGLAPQSLSRIELGQHDVVFTT